jgi:hypothetical protein
MIPNCVAFTRVRNEERIIQDTLDHVATFAGGIVVYDDCSTDSTPEIARAHPAVLAVIDGEFWDTPEDAHLPYTERRWFGPEYRDILMAYRNLPHLNFTRPDQREMVLRDRVVQGGWVKHYGKSESVEQWEETCEYYSTHFPEPYRSKWAARKGKAIKYDMKSDFGAPLMLWDERREKGYRLSS